MFLRLLFLFTVIPLVELAILVWLSPKMGLGPTLLLVLTTGLLGAVLGKREGLKALARLREDLAQGRMPADALLDGLAILVASIFLITPGVLTDVAGILLLLPFVRAQMAAWLKARFTKSLTSGTSLGGFQVHHIGMGSPFEGFGASQGLGRQSQGRGEVIDITPNRDNHPTSRD